MILGEGPAAQHSLAASERTIHVEMFLFSKHAFPLIAGALLLCPVPAPAQQSLALLWARGGEVLLAVEDLALGRLDQSDQVAPIISAFSQQIAPEALRVVGICAIMLTQSWRLTLAALATLPFYFLIARNAARLPGVNSPPS